MCGITGFWRFKEERAGVLKKQGSLMVKALAHRGPDDSGLWVDERNGLVLGHSRLSIIDLSPLGHQPMRSFCGRYVIVYNGEVYNFSELKKELERAGISFFSHCDTEVVAAAVSFWGIEKALKLFNGMFAFALWDKKEKLLYLARDRIGIKPLYYGFSGRTMFFSSELKAMRAHPCFEPRLSKDVLTLLLRHNYIPAPYSVYEGIRKLLPGHYCVINPDKAVQDFSYWDALAITAKSLSEPCARTEEEITGEMELLLKDAVKKRMISDVPLGAFLSGGIDSSLVVALMQSQSSSPVKSFTIGFNDGIFNEAEDAKKVSVYLGTDHTELYVTPQEAQSVIPALPDIFDEPFSDSSQIPTFLVSRMTRSHVTVSLSGDGGDELFGGYNRYHWADKLWKKLGKMPLAGKNFIASALKILPPESWQSIYDFFSFLIPVSSRQRMFGDKMHKLADVLSFTTPDELYFSLVSHWKDPSLVLPGVKEPDTRLNDKRVRNQLFDFVEKMMFFDLVTYLPDDILTKVDRASMSVSLEARVPLLDHRVVEYAKGIPLSCKIRNNRSKWILRNILYNYVPAELVERPKMGFGIPLDQWLRGPLREWAESLLDVRAMAGEGILNPEPIQRLWKEHLSGKRNWQYLLLDVLMFQAWKERWM